MRILCRVDAGPAVGLGHLQRCLSLAEALRRVGCESRILTCDHPQVRQRIAAAGFEMASLTARTLGGIDDLEQTVVTAAQGGCEAVVVDSYAIGPESLRALRDRGLFVAAIDDLARGPFPCHLVVNGGIHAARLSYHASSGETQFLLGPRYAMLRPAFQEVAARPIRPRARQLLLLVGGSDPQRLLPELLRELDTLPDDLVVSAVIGPCVEHVQAIEQAARACRHEVRLLHDPHAIWETMRDADLAVSAAGQTLYELAAVGCPTVAICVADNQEAQWQAFADAGVVRQAGRAGEPNLIRRVLEAVDSLLPNAPVREAMSAAGRQLVDGRGAGRVAEAMAGQLQAAR